MVNPSDDTTEDETLGASWDVCLFCEEPFDLATDEQLASPHWPYCSLLCSCRASLDSMEDDI